jgi:hypothetical protein
MPNASEHSLYKRLGGYDAIVAAVDDLLQRLHSDPQLGGYWKGMQAKPFAEPFASRQKAAKLGLTSVELQARCPRV